MAVFIGVLGLVLITTGLALVYPPLALVVLGGVLVRVATMIRPRPKSEVQ